MGAMAIATLAGDNIQAVAPAWLAGPVRAVTIVTWVAVTQVTIVTARTGPANQAGPRLGCCRGERRNRHGAHQDPGVGFKAVPVPAGRERTAGPGRL